MGMIEFVRTYEKCLREKFNYYMVNERLKPKKEEKEEYNRITGILQISKDYDFTENKEEFDELFKSIKDHDLNQLVEIRRENIKRRSHS